MPWPAVPGGLARRQSYSGPSPVIRLALGAFGGGSGRPEVGGLVTLLGGGSTLAGDVMHPFSWDGLELAAAIDCHEGPASYLRARRYAVMLPPRMPVRIQDN
jgi:hypothetical protein